MVLKKVTLQRILGIDQEICLSKQQMAGKVKVTFFPYNSDKVSKVILDFSKELEQSLRSLGVEIIPYEDTLTSLPFNKILKWYFYAILNSCLVIFKKLFKIQEKKYRPGFRALLKMKRRQRVKKGISIIALGQSKEGDLPMDHVTSFRNSFVITVLDMPKNIDQKSDFHEHFDTAMKLFTYHMSNIILAVDKDKLILYNLNAAHPIHLRKNSLEDFILDTLIPKLAAPILPPRLSEFKVKQESFNPKDKKYSTAIEDLIKGSAFMISSGLYPPGKFLKDFYFRNEFYRWVGKIHLDNRTGMSYGFLARQMPLLLPDLINWQEVENKYKKNIKQGKEYFDIDEKLYIILEVKGKKYCLVVPDVWVLTQRSGADKTNFNLETDLILMGLSNGKMILRTPKGLKIKTGYRPSFDSRVILAHAIGNAIIGSVLKHIYSDHQFVNHLEKEGLALSHWHGYFNKDYIPKGWYVYGKDNPHVSCSTPQSAIYALSGKLNLLEEEEDLQKNYQGDIHIEPHHGTNLSFSSLQELAVFFNHNPEATQLGNRYLNDY